MPLELGLEWVGKVELRRLSEEGNKDFGLRYAYLKNQKVEKKDLASSGSSGCTPGCSSAKTSVEPFEFSDSVTSLGFLLAVTISLL